MQIEQKSHFFQPLPSQMSQQVRIVCVVKRAARRTAELWFRDASGGNLPFVCVRVCPSGMTPCSPPPALMHIWAAHTHMREQLKETAHPSSHPHPPLCFSPPPCRAPRSHPGVHSPPAASLLVPCFPAKNTTGASHRFLTIGVKTLENMKVDEKCVNGPDSGSLTLTGCHSKSQAIFTRNNLI